MLTLIKLRECVICRNAFIPSTNLKKEYRNLKETCGKLDCFIKHQANKEANNARKD